MGVVEYGPREVAGVVVTAEGMVVPTAADEICCPLAHIAFSAFPFPYLFGPVFSAPLSPQLGAAFGFFFQILSAFFGVRGLRLRLVASMPLTRRLVPTASVGRWEGGFDLSVGVAKVVVVALWMLLVVSFVQRAGGWGQALFGSNWALRSAHAHADGVVS